MCSDKIALTGVERVAEVCMAACVLVQGFHPEDLGAGGGLVRHRGFISRAQENWRVVVTVLHVDHYFHKVPLNRDFLVSYLYGKKGLNAYQTIDILLLKQSPNVIFHLHE